MIGSTLSHYKVLEKLGEGGMGVVWKALDTKLDREVAIKLLPETFSADAERVARFEREAKLLASLNHRNIAAIYGVDESDGRRFLVMELVEGEDLSRKLERGPLPTDEAIDVCHQLARALEAAHEKGVLHRDLKPANVQVTPEGRVKVLDFGLAKAFEVEGDPAVSPTLTSAGTQAGMILGTAGYMSPEQARGKTLDKRTDIWSFGCVLFECLTGRAAFRGDTLSDTLASILKSEANWTLLPDRTPPRVRELLLRCFEKDARNRLRDIGDARLELQRSITGHESLSGVSAVSLAATVPEPARRFSLPVLAGVLVLGAAIGAGGWALVAGSGGNTGPGLSEVARFSIGVPRDHLLLGYLASPDGHTVGYSALPGTQSSDQVAAVAFLRRFGEYESVLIEGTEGFSDFAFSPDGRWAVARVPVAPKSTKFRVDKLSVDGSAPPLTLADLPDIWIGPLVWLPDGDILMHQSQPYGIVRIPSDGGRPSDPIVIENDGFEGVFGLRPSYASVLPGGSQVLGNVTTFDESGYNISVGLLDTSSGKARIIIDNGANPVWSQTGHVLFTRGATLLAVPFDPDGLEPVGPQVTVTDGLRAAAVYADAWFDIFPDGTLLHQPGGLIGAKRRLMFADEPAMTIGEPWSEELRPFEGGLSVSPDDRRLAVGIVNDLGFYEIWTSELERPRLTRLVRENGKDCRPAGWHPDGERLTYTCGAANSQELFIVSADGRETPQRLTVVEANETVTERYDPDSFAADGSALVVTHWKENEPELMLLSVADPDREPTLLLDDARAGQISPDGRWMAYISDASGREEVYLRAFDTDGTLGREIPVSRDGCGAPAWRSTLGETPLRLGYACQFAGYEVTVDTTQGVRFSEPRSIADWTEFWPQLKGGASRLQDGRWLAVIQGEDEEPSREINVVVNWREELRERLRAAR